MTAAQVECLKCFVLVPISDSVKIFSKLLHKRITVNFGNLDTQDSMHLSFYLNQS